MTIQEICNEIINGNFTNDEVTKLWNAVKFADKAVRNRQKNLVLATVQIGAIATLKGLSPKYLNGRTVKVTGVNKERVNVIELDSTGEEKPYATYRIPAQCLVLS